MPRSPRFVFPALPHHVVQRGNRRGDVFYSDADHVTYLDWLAEYCQAHRVEVLAYCLMTNHVHLIVVPEREDGLERVFRPLHMRYAQRINRNRQWSGHVWQGRFFSAALDEPYLWTALRYVERNPVRAGITGRAETYRWSSAAAHCGLRSDAVLTRDAGWQATLDVVGDWSSWLAEGDDKQRIDVLRQNLDMGLPCGSDEFVQRLERVAGQNLRVRPQGRPTKPSEKGLRPLY